MMCHLKTNKWKRKLEMLMESSFLLLPPAEQPAMVTEFILLLFNCCTFINKRYSATEGPGSPFSYVGGILVSPA